MLKEKEREFLLDWGFQVSKDEVRRQNRLAIRYFAFAGLPVAFANVAVQSVIQGVPITTPKNWVLPLVFFVLLILDRFVIPKNTDNSTLLVYALEAPVMVVSILLGTVWDPTHQAVTFPMFMSVIPIFIFDAPLRVAAVGLGWNIVFVALAALVKDPSVVPADVAHAIEFALLSFAVTIIVLRLRFEVVYNLDRATYHLKHDVLTDTQNRLSLISDTDRYLGRPLFVTMGSVDHLSLINDFYGKQTGDEVIGTFADVMKGVFGTEWVYRLTGDEFLCIAEGDDPEHGLELVEEVRRRVASSRFEGMNVTVSLSFGYVWGRPGTDAAFNDMVQLATIYAHKAHRQADATLVGAPFDVETLKAAIVQSNIDAHAQAHEVNQLTGLPAMPYFVLHAQETLLHVADLTRRPVIGYLNIRSFRTINDKYGYAKGDEVIKTMAHLLQEALPNRHITYVTGSKFAFLCYLDEVEPTIEHLEEGLAAQVPDETFSLRAGFVEYHEGEQVISLIDKARMAFSSVQSGQKACWRLYDEELDDQLRLSRYLVAHLDEAIEKGWLKVFYQPIMWCATEHIANLEALSRWDDPIFGMLPPYKFISVLEREHLIYKLSLHVVRQALADIKRLKDQGLPFIPVSVNLSRNDFLACDMVSEIARLVEQAGLEPWVLSIEITESAFAESEEMLGAEVERFHERGFAVWMDDFGSEYSTLNLLEDLNFDLVKLDMRLMRNFSSSSRNAIIVSSIVEMCSRLGMETLVEGVEETDQRDMLEQMGTGKLQGFLYSRPLPYDEVCLLIKDRGWA